MNRVLTGLATAFLNGFTLMMLVGAIHGSWIHQLPTLGYWWAVLYAFLGAAFLRVSLFTLTAKTN